MKQNPLDKFLFDGINKSIPSEKKPNTLSEEGYDRLVNEAEDKYGDPDQLINTTVFSTNINNWNYAISTILKRIVEKGCFEFSIYPDKKYLLKLDKEQIKSIKNLINIFKTIHLKIGNISLYDKLHFYQNEVTKILHQRRRYDDVGKQKMIRDEIESFLLNQTNTLKSPKSSENNLDIRFKAVSYWLKLHFIAEGRYDKMGHQEFCKTQTKMNERFFNHFSSTIINKTIKILKDNSIKYKSITAIIYLLSNGYVYLDSNVLRKRYSRLK